MLKKISDRIVYRDPRFHAAFPATTTLADGQVLVMFRRARDHRWLHKAANGADDPNFGSIDHVDPRSHLALVRLSPELEPLGDPECLPPDPEAADQDASLLTLRDGRLLVGSFCWYPFSPAYGPVVEGWGGGYAGQRKTTGCLFLFWGGFTRFSDDGGRSWTPHRFLPAVPDHPDLVPGVRPYLGGAVRGRPAEAPDGTLLLATYATNARAGGRAASHLFASTDRGETWSYRSRMAVADDSQEIRTGFAEPALHIARDGRLIAFHRSFGLEDRLVTATSTDLGRTWRPYRVHAVRGHPFDVAALPDGRLVAVYGYRHEPYGIRARVWDPATQEIDDAQDIVVRDDGPTRDVGYPSVTVLPDGRVFIAYYFCDAGEGIRHIAASTMACD